MIRLSRNRGFADIFIAMLLVVASVMFLTRVVKYRKQVLRVAQSETLSVGEEAPQVSYLSEDGELVDVSALRGRVMLVIFGVCESCYEEIPFWNQVHKAITEYEVNTRIIGLYVSGFQNYSQFTLRQPVLMPVLFGDVEDVVEELRLRKLTQVYELFDGVVRGVYFNPTRRIGEVDKIIRDLGLSPSQLEWPLQSSSASDSTQETGTAFQ